jgi:transposase-like protein
MKAREKFTGMNSIKFNRYFQTDADCYKYLSEIKWQSGYLCAKCGHNKHYNGAKPHSRRCMRCKYDESPTARTLFDRCKFPLLVAFHIVFKVSTKKKGMSSEELSREFELRQKTCWDFKRKIQLAMASSERFPIIGEVQVDEFFIGQYEKGKQGRSTDSKKKQVIVALEILPNGGAGRAYAKMIKSASAKEFRPFFASHISKDSKVITDVWKGYLPLRKDYPKLQQVPSNKGLNLKELHIHIMNIQGWLRGIHHFCSKEHLQGYLDEYHYRYNRRNNMDTIFDLTIKKMVEQKPNRININDLTRVA